MDIIAHGLWGATLTKTAQLKTKYSHLKPVQSFLWGMFPDLFAFTVPFTVLIYRALFFGVGFVRGKPDPSTFPFFNLAHELYNYSHSLVIFVAVFALVWFFRKRPKYELLAWGFHILCDIPTHTKEFFPTPILFPLSTWKFTHGFSWGAPWFMALNYSALALVFLLTYLRGKRKTRVMST